MWFFRCLEAFQAFGVFSKESGKLTVQWGSEQPPKIKDATI